jgi:hypothetical protein
VHQTGRPIHHHKEYTEPVQGCGSRWNNAASGQDGRVFQHSEFMKDDHRQCSPNEVSRPKRRPAIRFQECCRQCRMTVKLPEMERREIVEPIPSPRVTPINQFRANGEGGPATAHRQDGSSSTVDEADPPVHAGLYLLVSMWTVLPRQVNRQEPHVSLPWILRQRCQAGPIGDERSCSRATYRM